MPSLGAAISGFVRCASGTRALSPHVFWLLSVLAAAAAAAILAHVGIDIAGDYVLPHDPYDDLPHDSRITLAALGIGVAVMLLLFVSWSVVVEASGGRRTLRRTLALATGRSPWASIAAVNGVVLPMLAMMGAVDGILAGGEIPTFVNAVGGSLALCLAVAVPTASVVGLATWCAMRLLVRSLGTIVAAIGRIITIVRAFDRDGVVLHREPVLARKIRHGPIIGGNAGKRGPPLFA